MLGNDEIVESESKIVIRLRWSVFVVPSSHVTVERLPNIPFLKTKR